MTQLARRRRQRTIAAFCSGLVGVMLLPLLGFLSVDALRSSKEGRNALSDLPPLIPIPPTPGALLAVTDDSGVIASLVVLALRPPSDDGIARGGTIIVVPAGVRTPIEDGTSVRLAETYVTGGVPALQAAVEGALSVSLSRTDVVDEDGLAAVLAPLGSISVDLSVPLTDGSSEILPQGAASLDPTTLAGALASPIGPSELDRLPAIGDLWAGVAARVGDGIGTAPADPTTSIESFSTAIFAGSLGSYRLSAVPVTDPAENPTGLDMVRLNFGEATLVTATVLPSAVSPPYATVRFFVLSPLGDPRYTLEAVSRLLFAGANVVLVKEDGNTVTPKQNTISFLDAATGDEAKRFADLLGPYDVTPVDQRIDGVDVVLTLGSEFIADADLDRRNAPTTVPGAATPFTSDATDDTTTDTLTEEG